jgi:hypothetical protein
LSYFNFTSNLLLLAPRPSDVLAKTSQDAVTPRRAVGTVAINLFVVLLATSAPRDDEHFKWYVKSLFHPEVAGFLKLSFTFPASTFVEIRESLEGV